MMIREGRQCGRRWCLVFIVSFHFVSFITVWGWIIDYNMRGLSVLNDTISEIGVHIKSFEAFSYIASRLSYMVI